MSSNWVATNSIWYIFICMRLLIEAGLLRSLTEEINFSSFLEQDTLCPYIFHDNLRMKQEIAQNLMRIAKDFYDFLEFDWLSEDSLYDVQLVGSLASYNWSENYSDIDLHLVLDFSEVSPNTDLVERDLWAMKMVYNQQHNIQIKGFDVELYAQDLNEEVESNGIFSIMRQTWIKKPEKLKPTLDKRRIASIVAAMEAKIKTALSEYRSGNYDYARELAENLMEELKTLRKQGLSRGGEFSPENLAYKALRRNSMLDKVHLIATKSFDGEVSVDKTSGEKLEIIKKQREAKAKLAQDKVGTTKSVEVGKPKKGDGYSDGIVYKIMGKSFTSLRDAEDSLGIPHSTLNYRVNSKSPKWGSYKKLTTNK